MNKQPNQELPQIGWGDYLEILAHEILSGKDLSVVRGLLNLDVTGFNGGRRVLGLSLSDKYTFPQNDASLAENLKNSLLEFLVSKDVPLELRRVEQLSKLDTPNRDLVYLSFPRQVETLAVSKFVYDISKRIADHRLGLGIEWIRAFINRFGFSHNSRYGSAPKSFIQSGWDYSGSTGNPLKTIIPEPSFSGLFEDTFRIAREKNKIKEIDSNAGMESKIPEYIPSSS